MIRKAKLSDAESIYKIINTWAKEGRLLERSLNYIYENIRDFWVYEYNKKIVGCCALHVVGWEDLAEIKSLAVKKEYHNKGIGKKLVLKCLEEAKSLGIKKVFALTFIPSFFLKLKFVPIDRKQLPHKIWSDCVDCIFFPNCNEEAVIYKIS
ncbi:MAG: N-acetyltransferase [Candidatus Omnitrophica bacterium]|nr:N-acetyltransferase [Candidatus Omnitrophota bacterium]